MLAEHTRRQRVGNLGAQCVTDIYTYILIPNDIKQPSAMSIPDWHTGALVVESTCVLLYALAPRLTKARSNATHMKAARCTSVQQGVSYVRADQDEI